MTPTSLLYSVCAIACVAGALITVVARNPVRGAVGLLTTIVGIAGLFLKLSAQFLAAIQLIVYAGAVVVLFVFVIMLLGPDAGAALRGPGKARLARAFSGALFVVVCLSGLRMLAGVDSGLTRFGAARPEHGSVEAIGALLFGPGVVPFELSTALLVVAIVGAIGVARGKQGVAKDRRGPKKPKELFVGPLLPRDDRGRPVHEEAAP